MYNRHARYQQSLFENNLLTSDLVDGFSKTLDVAAGDTRNGYSPVFGSIHRVLERISIATSFPQTLLSTDLFG